MSYEARRVRSLPYSFLADADNFLWNISTSRASPLWLGPLRLSWDLCSGIPQAELRSHHWNIFALPRDIHVQRLGLDSSS